MSNVIYPPHFHDLSDHNVPWVTGWAVIVGGDIYLKTAKVWHIERDDYHGCVYIDYISESVVEYLGRDPETLRKVWSTRFLNEQFTGSLLPPCDFDEAPPKPHSRRRKTVKRDYVNMIETIVYEGAA